MAKRRSRAELDRLIRGLGRQRKSPQPIPRQLRDGSDGGGFRFPASFAQRRMWLLDQLAPGRPTYNVAGAIEVVATEDEDGPLGLPSPIRLREVLSRLVGRHEVLRTHFVEVEGEPEQVVTVPAEAQLALSEVDLEGFGPVEQTLERGLDAEARRPFDLAQGPLFRALWWRLEAGRGVLQLTLHHSIADGWSLGVLLRELAQCFTNPSELPPLPVQVADHAVWQREQYEEGSHDEALSAARARLGGLEELELPVDRRRPARPSGRGHRVDFNVDPALSGRLGHLARERGTTPFALFATVLGTFLSRHGGSTDIAIGFPTAGRRRRELEPLVGCFVETRVLRLDLSGDPGVAELLDRGKDAVRQAEEHPEIPFEVVVEAVAPERSATSPLFQGMLVYETEGLEPTRVGPLELRPRELWTGTAKFDLTLGIRGTPDGSRELTGWWEADADLFDRPTLQRFTNRLRVLLAGMVENPNRTRSTLPLLRPSELQELIHERAWGPSAPVPPSLPEVLASRLAAEGDAPALVMSGDPSATLSFAELGSQAASLASHLQALGVGPESVVALLMERSPSLVVSALAVWWAGGAYVPLDLEHPESRQSFQLEDSGAQWLIGSGERAERLAAAVDGLVLVAGEPQADQPGLRLSPHPPSPPLPPSGEGGAREESPDATDDSSEFAGVGLGGARERKRSVPRVGTPAQAKSHALHETSAGPVGPVGVGEQAEPRPTPATPPDPNALAYVLYTSGSTGRPKGVEVTHGGLARYVDWAKGAYRADEGTGTLVHSPLGFDLTVTGLWVPLAAGRPVTLISETEGVEGLERALREGHDRTLIKLTPSHLEVLRHRVPPEELSGRARALVIGGEALHAETLAPWLEHAPETRLINEYGPTETVVGCCIEIVETQVSEHRAQRNSAGDTKVDGSRDAVVPIGRPITGTGLWVVDRALRPMPPGSIGELVIGGEGVARGYRGRPGLTAERFVPDPFSGRPGARLYTSGDRVRSLADGRLTYLGRTDHQVKIRGHRIEPGEIEAAALALPGVEEAVVVARPHATGPRLVAYVTGPVTPEIVESGLGEALPAAWVPSAVLVLDELPRLPNGKFDRRHLPEPSWSATEAGQAPRTPLETELLELWVSLLELDDEAAETAGVDSDFFRLGGHSLLATRLLARVRDRWGVEVTLRELFEAPTVAALASWVEQRQESEDTSSLPALEARPEGTPGAPTFAQERLWFLHRLDPDDPTYHVGIRIDLRGQVDLRVLARSLDTVVARHDVLRSHFPEVGGELTLAIDLPAPLALSTLDLRDLPREHATTEAERRIATEVRRPFDLGRGPLIRALWIDLGTVDGRPEGRLILTLHHTVSDGWSLGILLGELATVYATTLAGGQAKLPTLPVQVADYALWQRQLMEDAERREPSLDYWRRSLGDVPVLALPSDRPRRARSPRRGGWRAVQVSPDLANGLRQLAAEHGTTLFAVLLAGFWGLLSRLSTQRDFALGTTLATRRDVALEGLIGDFVDTLALRIEADGSEEFVDLLERAQDRLLDGESHRWVPFEQILSELDVERDLGSSPVFQAILVLLNTPTQSLDLPGCELTVRPLSTGTAKFDLTLSLAEDGGSYDVPGAWSGGLLGILEYDRDLFDTTTVERWWRGFETLLRGVLDQPDRPLGVLPLLAAGERHQLVWEWNATRAGFPDRATIPARIKAVAQSRGDAIAVVGESLEGERVELTYGELLTRSRWVADHLRRLGVGRGTLVGVCLERSVDLVATLLGVLESGAAYLPIDLAYPAERLAFMLEDGGAPVLLSQRSLSDRLPEVAGVETVWTDGFDEDGAGEAPRSPAEPPHPSDLAYVIYTSGSTGRPKGVLIPHQNVARLLSATEPWFDFGPDDVWTFFHSHAFDFSVWEIWACLATGGRLVVVPYWQSRSPEALATLLRNEGVTILNQTPSAFRQLMTVMVSEASAEDGPLALRRVIFGGEALEPATLAPWFDRFGDTQPLLVNMFGITETTVHVTYRPLSSDSAAAVGSPVGTVIPDQTVRLLDRRGLPAPLGVAGEIHVGGAGLAWGYLGRPGLTAERFVPDPWGAPGARQYRSGDLGRYLASGELDFLGRIDHQVKVRGFRIELGEIEAALLAHPAVSEAVVLAEGSGDETRLVAYAVGAPGEEVPTASCLRESLEARLPEYMVPSAVLWLDALPLTANGKLDRAALARIEVEEALGELYVAPRTPLEARVAEVFAEVLDRDRVGVDDDFFALGGHSLLATRVVARLRQALGVDVVLRQLFEAPTVARLSAALDRSDLATLETIPRRSLDRAALSPGQERLWFLDQLDPGRATYNIPLRLAIEGELDRGRLAAALVALAQRHEVLRTTYETEGEHPVQVVQALDPDDSPLPFVDLSALPESRRRAEVDRRAEAEACRPFDLARGPVWRTLLLAESASRHTLVLTFHHIAADGASISVVLREVAASYRGEPLEPLAIQISDHAVWQRKWLEGEGAEASLDWWREHLAEVPSLELPFDRPRPAVARQRGRSIPVALSAKSVASLEARCREQGATLFQGLLAVFGVTLARVTHQGEFAVGTPMANRPRVELEGLVGFLVNTLALRVSVEAGAEGAGDRKGFQGLLDRVREELLAVSAHEGVPFERVVQAVDPERDLSAPPLFQAFLAFQDLAGSTESVGALGPGVSWRPSSISTGVAKFDLSLALQRDAEGVRGEVELDRDLFDRTTGERLARRIGTVLSAVLASPERDVWDLEVLAPAERHQLVWEQAGPWVAPAQDTLVDRIGAVARRSPERIAILGEDGSEWSYEALWSASCALAVELWERLGEATKGEPIVGLCLDRSPELVVGMLAAQLAGAAYAPLDPTYPRERLGFILDDTSAPVIVTREGLEDRLPETEAHRLDVRLGPHPPSPPLPRAGEGGVSESEHSQTQPRPSLPQPPSPRHPDGLACLIYTSGSTGRPKGVAISHRSALTLIDGLAPVFPDSDLEGVLAATSINFDLSIFELFGTLVRGGTLVLAQDALALPEHPARDRVRLINTVPSAMAELVRGGWLPPELSTVNLAGEPLRRALVDGIHGVSPGARVLNLYGPSEDTTYSTWVLAQRGLAAEPTIGRPVAGTVAHIVDPRGRPVPLGSEGELVLGGLGLARGYLARPSLTARSFVPDGLGSTPGDRLYRTGDRVRRRADGELVFLGRFDHQVKVRGYRIELGEIEVALLVQPTVSDAVVLVLGEGSAARLVGCVEGADATGGPDPEDLREALSSKLPAPLVPSGWLVLDALPRLPNGKVDRKALRRQAEHSVGDGATVEYVAPRSPLEATVAEIFADVLDQERVGIKDDFFALGGHSLLATRVVARLRGATGLEIPLRQLFEAPTVARLAAVLETQEGQGLPPVTAQPLRDSWPLTFGQERLWLLDRLSPGAQYNMPLALRLEGPLDRHRLGRALAAVVERHAGLRAVFPSRQGGPIQRLQPLSEQVLGGEPLPTVDLEALPPDPRAAVGARLLRSEARRPFDLQRGPLWRGLLLRSSTTLNHILLGVHHIVADGVSLGILADEIATRYGGTDPDRTLEPLPVQMVDLAVWQRRHVDDEALAPDLEFWRDRLEGVEPLDLPTDRPRRAVQRLRGAVVRGRLGSGLGAAVEALARRTGSTPFLVQLAVFEVLLWRLAGRSEGAVGTPVAGRDGVEVEPLIGFLVNTLVQRFRIDPRETFEGWVEQVRHDFLATWDRRRLPFERLVTALAPDRDLARNPLFQVLFTVQAMPEPRLGDLSTTVVPVDTGTAKVDLSVVVVPRADGNLDWVAELDRDLFDHTTVRRFLGTYERLLASAVASPTTPLEALDSLAPAERHQVLVEWGGEPGIGVDGGAETVVGAILEHASQHPSAPALVRGGEQLGYSELVQRATDLATHLRAAGVGQGAVVAVVGERGPALVVGWLASWLVGAAYLPLDAKTPPQRLGSLLEDAEATAVLADAVGRRLRYPSGRGESAIPWLDLESSLSEPCSNLEAVDSPEREGDPGSVPHGAPRSAPVSPNDLAYVLYTSGSTGRPKGVLVSHRTLTALSRWHRATSELGRGCRVSQLASPAFDAMVWEVWPALAAGATVVFAPDEAQTSAAALIAFFERSRIEVAFVPTPLAELALQREWPVGIPFRRLLTGGDRLRSWSESRHRFDLVNHYGPTENTVVATWGRVETGPRSGLPDIGRPLPGVRALVLSRDLRPVPLGAAGELVLGEVGGGGQLARGYLGRPTRTAEAFVPEPSWLDRFPGGRLYRTGDRVRFAADGRIEFLGRLDHQVKVRGVRIELGEIEAVLASHPQVTAAAVVVVRPEDGAPNGESRLVAFVTGSGAGGRADGGPPDDGALRSWLGDRLPAALVPQRVVTQTQLPTTRNGKLDRRALEATARRSLEESEGRTPWTAPTTALERRLAEVVGRVLGVERLGRDTNFFEAGASSLSMAEIADRLGETSGRPVAVVDVFRFPTLRALARHLGHGSEDAGGDAKTLSEADSRAERRRQLGGRRRRRRG